jgi:hypothetical protein
MESEKIRAFQTRFLTVILLVKTPDDLLDLVRRDNAAIQLALYCQTNYTY